MAAVKAAGAGGGVLLLADEYPSRTQTLAPEVLATAKSKNLRLYVEYPGALPDIEVGYVYRTGAATRKDFEFVPTPCGQRQATLMIERCAELATATDKKEREEHANATRRTQQYLDALWQALDG